MKITERMVNWLMVQRLAKPPKTGEGGEGGFLLGPYMEYPPEGCKRRYVIQHHWRGKSVHSDWRMEYNDHLLGWSVLDNPPDTPFVASLQKAREVYRKLKKKFQFRADNKNVGLRAETKARQPKSWLMVEGVVPPGGVGATKNYPGVFLIIDKGVFWAGAQKPYFHEYFVKSEMKDSPFPNDKYTRIILRAVNVQVIDPETKEPRPGKELMWRVMIPGDQTAYALKRGLKKKWLPPRIKKGKPPKVDTFQEKERWVLEHFYIPIPPDQRKGDLWKKWIEFVFTEAGKEKLKEKGKEKEFVLHFNSWMGPVHVRGIPKMQWYLRWEEGKGCRTFFFTHDPSRFAPLMAEEEGRSTDLTSRGGDLEERWFSFRKMREVLTSPGMF